MQFGAETWATAKAEKKGKDKSHGGAVTESAEGLVLEGNRQNEALRSSASF